VRPMPDLNHSSKHAHAYLRGVAVSRGHGKGPVTIGARNIYESLPFSVEVVEQ